ncbi:hypothetical protein DWQ65_02085 [Treponema phagedenis]|nr:hypothetical protein DWQ65_02085 [Treponema phagedenis]
MGGSTPLTTEKIVPLGRQIFFFYFLIFSFLGFACLPYAPVLLWRMGFFAVFFCGEGRLLRKSSLRVPVYPEAF